MAEYDSILKEKKKYEEPVKNNEPKPFPWLKMDIFSIVIVLFISYIFYYNKILTPDKIFLTDLAKLTDQYLEIFTPLKLNELTNEDYNVEGNIQLEDTNYYYKINKNEDKTNLFLSLNNNSLTYYTLSNDIFYIKLSSFQEQYIKLSDNNYLNIFQSLKDYFSNHIPTEKFIKKFYLIGTNPIVESNLVLNNEDLKTALGLNNLDNSYEILFTFKNHAITNDIISMKITINNQTTNKRTLIQYEKGILTYKDDNNNLKLQLEKQGQDFILKVYQEDTLFSVLTGTSGENSYQYMYQVIDKIYNITLTVSEEADITSYEVVSNIEKEGTTIKPNLTITLTPSKEMISELPGISVSEIKNYEELTDEERENYQSNLDEIVNKLRQFIEEYQ